MENKYTMPRQKERRKILHEPSTQEILLCLSYMPEYGNILLTHRPDVAYHDFLKWLTDHEFFRGDGEKTTVKKLAVKFGTDAAKLTRWIKLIYNDIFQLNQEQPALFQVDNIKVSLICSNYDDHASFDLSLPVLPSVFDIVRFPFLKAKVGIDYFWVSKIEHEIENNKVNIVIWLNGGSPNRYREGLIERALFHNKIGFMDTYDKLSFEMDELLKKIYRE